MHAEDSAEGRSRPASVASSVKRGGNLVDRMKETGDTPGLLRGANRRSLTKSPAISEPVHDQDYLDHVRSISVTPVQQQQAKQDALERSSIASSASSSSSQRGHTRPSFDSVGLRSNYTVSSSRSQAANISTIPSAASARPPRAFSRPHSITQSSTHPSCRPRVQSPDSGSAPRSVREPPLRSARHRQRPTKPDGSFAPSIAPSSMLTPPSVYSQATTSSGYSTAASADYNPLTYRPKDAVRTYRASESFKPIPDSDTFSIPPPPLAPSFHPTMPVTYFPRDPPNDHYVDGTPRTTPHATSMHTLTGSRAPPPQTGTTTPTTSVAWSDTDYHLENGRIVDSGQSSVTNGSSTYLPSLTQPDRHKSSTHGSKWKNDTVERNMNSITMNWEKAKLDAKFGMFRARQRIKKGISG